LRQAGDCSPLFWVFTPMAFENQAPVFDADMKLIVVGIKPPFDPAEPSE
jgi:hypothetical protein